MTIGYNHLYYGWGKGKTSILNGLIIRAYGNDLRVKYYRFLKNRFTGENQVFAKLNIEFANCYASSDKFFWEMNDAERAVLKTEVLAGYQALMDDITSDNYDLIVVDELFDCVVDQLISDQDIINLLAAKPVGLELAFSAHQVNQQLFPYFDLISEVRDTKHYFNTMGVQARKGIEF